MRRLPRRVQGRRGPPLTPDVAWGEVLAGLAGCRECHSTADAAPFAGGEALATPFGAFTGPNVTPDPVHGIGGWSDRDFARAVRRGRDPDGGAYWPVFPYAAFSGLTDDDLADLWAYLRAQAPDPAPSAAQEPQFGRVALWAWRRIGRGRPFRPTGDAELDRGAYLVEVVGHCDGCHSPRTRIGLERDREHLAGTEQHDHGGPNLTPGPDGLEWTEQEWVDFLSLGETPDGDFVGGAMKHVIRDGTTKLSDADRLAMARYLRSLPARPDAP